MHISIFESVTQEMLSNVLTLFSAVTCDPFSYRRYRVRFFANFSYKKNKTLKFECH